MRLFIIHPHLSFYGGAETLLMNFTRYLETCNIDYLIGTLTYSKQVESYFPREKIIIPTKSKEFALRSVNVISAVGLFDEIFSLRQIIVNNCERSDILILSNFPATWAAFFTGLRNPTIWMCNEPPDLWNNLNPSLFMKILWIFAKKIDQFIISSTNYSICVADKYNADRVFNRYKKISTIIPYGVEFEIFSKGDKSLINNKYPISNDDFIITHTGILSPQKNQMMSIQVLQKLIDVIPNIKLILVGKGDNIYQEVLKKYVNKHHLSNFVIFTGHVHKKELANIYDRTNIVIFPMKDQGGWLSPFEALSAEKIILVSPEMTIADIIKSNNIGVVDKNYYNRIIDIYHNYDDYKNLAMRGKNWTSKNLIWDRYSKQLLDTALSLMI